MPGDNHRFYRDERLKSRKVIGSLFQPGSLTVSSYPLRIVYRIDNLARTQGQRKVKIQAAFVVPKRKFRKATDRNHIKRKMKEAYRLHKDLILQKEVPEQPAVTIALLIMYTGKEIMDFRHIERKMIKLLPGLLSGTEKS